MFQPLVSLRLLFRRTFRDAGRLTPLITLFALATTAMLIGFLMGRRHPAPPVAAGRLEVAVLNVGQGESSWIRTPNNRFILIGAGPTDQGGRVVASLRDAGARRIDLLVLPYPYAEAIGGLGPVMDALPVTRAVEPGGPVVNQWQSQARQSLAQRKVPLIVGRPGRTFVVDGVVLTVLAPAEPLLNANPAAANNSLVVKAKWGATSFLWEGGVERAGEEALLARTPDLGADWLRAAHFGTREASSPEFLRQVSPEFVVVSVGANSAGYPHPEAIQRLEATGARLYRTDSQPDPLLFFSDGARVVGPE